MPRFFCDYCDAYLTHDSAPGRQQHIRGWKHRENFKSYYQSFHQQWVMEQQMKQMQMAQEYHHQMMAQQQQMMASSFTAPPFNGQMMMPLAPNSIPSGAPLFRPPPSMIPPHFQQPPSFPHPAKDDSETVFDQSLVTENERSEQVV